MFTIRMVGGARAHKSVSTSEHSRAIVMVYVREQSVSIAFTSPRSAPCISSKRIERVNKLAATFYQYKMINFSYFFFSLLFFLLLCRRSLFTSLLVDFRSVSRLLFLFLFIFFEPHSFRFILHSLLIVLCSCADVCVCETARAPGFFGSIVTSTHISHLDSLHCYHRYHGHHGPVSPSRVAMVKILTVCMVFKRS